MSDSYSRFTKRAKQVLQLATEEARDFKHNHIGTEHLLLGLIREREGIAAKVLDEQGVTLEQARKAVAFIVGAGTGARRDELELTGRAQKVIKYAIEESNHLEHHYVGTEHLLLGLVRLAEGVAIGVLDIMEVPLERVHDQLLHIMRKGPIAGAGMPIGGFETADTEVRIITQTGARPVIQLPPTKIARLTTHVLDTAQGKPARGVQIELWVLSAQGERTLLKTVCTNADGRTDEPLLLGQEFHAGQYELVFDVGAYFAKQAVFNQNMSAATPPFLTLVPVRFTVADAGAHYHVPLLVSPWAYSTYRGS